MTDLASRLAEADDRTLSALLASHLFGHIVNNTWEDAHDIEVGLGAHQRLETIPLYLTPSGALAVIEAMGEKGYAASLFFDPQVSIPEKHECRFVHYAEGRPLSRGRGMAYAHTLPRAVAESALLALHAAGDLPPDALAILRGSDD